jgi:hypothetical protein
LLTEVEQSSATTRYRMNREHRETEKIPANSPRAKTGSRMDWQRRADSNGGGKVLYTVVMLN